MTSRSKTFCKSTLLFVSLSMIAALVACSSSSHNSGGGGTTTPSISLATNPSPLPSTLAVGGTVSLTATITNDSSGANWSAACGSTTAGACGTFSASNTASGTAVTYTAPATVPASAVVITAAVADDASITAVASGITITTTPTIALTTSPSPLPSTLVVGGTVQLTATITNDTSGANWTAACGSTTAGACGTFSANNTASGTAVTYTAPATVPPSPVVITASVADDTSVNKSPSAITITATVANTYVFYASGEELINGGFSTAPNYYAIAGAVTIDALGDVLAGEQDYNDGIVTANDLITPVGTALVASPSGNGLYTLTITTADTSVGVNGTEKFAVQFVNASHALITQFDGTATSSGSLDLQTATTASGNFAFTLSGVDPSYLSVAFGGVYASSGGTWNGVIDGNDTNSIPSTGNTLSANEVSDGLGFGRSVVTTTINSSPGITFAEYVVGPEAVRIIDIDFESGDSVIGSAYGQGSGTTFSNASLGNSVFGLLGQWSEQYATLGEFGTDSGGNITGGLADDNELDSGIQQTALAIDNTPHASTYDLVSSGINGYGSIHLSWAVPAGPTPDVSLLGLYMVDPNLNINDPNASGSGQPDVGGALIMDMVLPGGIGVITPQTSGSFGGTYVAGFQDFNGFEANSIGICLPDLCEFDMVSQGTVAGSSTPNVVNLSLTGADSDPFGTWDGTPAESTGDTFTSAAQNLSFGYYSMSSVNNNLLEATINAPVSGGEEGIDVDVYQASGTTLYWIETDQNGVFLGPIEMQGTLPTFPAAKKPAVKAQPSQSKKAK